MNRYDIMRIAQEAKLYEHIPECTDCALRIPNLDGLERFAFLFFQAARAEMIKQDSRLSAEAQSRAHNESAEAAILAERKACAEELNKLAMENENASQDAINLLRLGAIVIHARGNT